MALTLTFIVHYILRSSTDNLPVVFNTNRILTLVRRRTLSDPEKKNKWKSKKKQTNKQTKNNKQNKTNTKLKQKQKKQKTKTKQNETKAKQNN